MTGRTVRVTVASASLCAAAVACAGRHAASNAPMSAPINAPVNAGATSLADAGAVSSTPAKATTSTLAAARFDKVGAFPESAFAANRIEDRADTPRNLYVVAGKTVLVGCQTIYPIGADLAVGAGIPVQLSTTAPWCLTVLAVDQGRLIVKAGEREVRSVDVATGRSSWTFLLRAASPTSSVVVTDRACYVVGSVVAGVVGFVTATTDGLQTAYFLRASTGKLLWKREHAEGIATDGTSLFVLERGDATLDLSSVDPAGAAPRWTTHLPSLALPTFVLGSFALHADRIAVAESEHLGDGNATTHLQVVLIDAKTGQVSATSDVPEHGRPRAGRAVFAGNQLYVVGDSLLARIDPVTGVTQWSIPGSYETVVAAADAIFTMHTLEADGIVRALDPSTGAEVWAYGLGLNAKGGLRSNHLDILPATTSSPPRLVAMTNSGGDVPDHAETTTIFGPTPSVVPPHAKTFSLEVHTQPETRHPITLRIGDQTGTFTGKTWTGTLHGRGRLVAYIERGVENVRPFEIDFENGQSEESERVEFERPQMQQGCALP